MNTINHAGHVIPRFNPRTSISTQSARAIDTLREQGLLPNQPVNKQELLPDDRELVYICTVYASLVQDKMQ